MKKSPSNEDLPSPDSSPDPKSVDIPNPAVTSKKERRGNKKKNPKSKQKFGNRKGQSKTVNVNLGPMEHFTANEAISAQVLVVQRVRCKQVFEGLLPLYEAFEPFVANAKVREVDDCQARIVSESLKISHE